MFVCERCHYETQHKHNLSRHLSKDKVCPAIYSQISREILYRNLGVKKHNKENKLFSCQNCSLSFTHASSLSRHSKNCLIQTDNSSIEEMRQTITELQQEVIALKQQPIQNITINNHTINNNLIIQKRDFERENIQHLMDDHQFMYDCLYQNNVVKLIDAIYCDPEHPENHIVRLRNINRGIMEYFNNNQWIPCKQDELLERLLNRGYTILKTYFRKNSNDVKTQVIEDGDDDMYNKIIEWLDTNHHNDRYIKNIKQDIIILFMYNKTLLLAK